MTKSDKLITEYRAAIRAMREGRFDSPIPIDHNNEIGKLGHDLNELARELERKFSEAIKMQEISEKIPAADLSGWIEFWQRDFAVSNGGTFHAGSTMNLENPVVHEKHEKAQTYSDRCHNKRLHLSGEPFVGACPARDKGFACRARSYNKFQLPFLT